MVVRDGEMVCVELVARGRGAGALAVLFLGSIRYDALSRVYDSRQSSLSTKVAQRMSFGLLGRAAARCEFVRMKGPAGKGHAEMAGDKSRSENEGLDSLSAGVAEVEAGDLRDVLTGTNDACKKITLRDKNSLAGNKPGGACRRLPRRRRGGSLPLDSRPARARIRFRSSLASGIR
ncbi:hypothetical protein MSG28_001843 [Choristoneura fumiferana]|uniref:Uncharacterized protein n=1 Tax=Choristoneura fumiferana TaxID=7141 RepID=A0ACC0KWR6_CHOFU|nr:hypothetical protein MSG28_001843 [Choristoneura fumiferana]